MQRTRRFGCGHALAGPGNALVRDGAPVQGVCFVFSSRRRHTRLQGDWSSDVCSSDLKAGDVVVIRYEGPVGGPGMREMLGVTGALVGEGLGDSVALITDGRFSGATHGLMEIGRASCRERV